MTQKEFKKRINLIRNPMKGKGPFKNPELAEYYKGHQWCIHEGKFPDTFRWGKDLAGAEQWQALIDGEWVPLGIEPIWKSMDEEDYLHYRLNKQIREWVECNYPMPLAAECECGKFADHYHHNMELNEMVHLIEESNLKYDWKNRTFDISKVESKLKYLHDTAGMKPVCKECHEILTAQQAANRKIKRDLINSL